MARGEKKKKEEFHRDPTQKLNQTNNFYYRNSHMEIEKKVLCGFK